MINIMIISVCVILVNKIYKTILKEKKKYMDMQFFKCGLLFFSNDVFFFYHSSARYAITCFNNNLPLNCGMRP